MSITSFTLISIDGVIQGNGGPDEDRRGGFERGGWARGNPDPEVLECICDLYEQASAYLFGRWTYDLFSNYWGTMPVGTHRIADALTSRPKYVVSSTITRPSWANSTVLPANAIQHLSGNIQVHGSPSLLRWLLDQDLLDEIALLTVPVVVGQGARLFAESGPFVRMELMRTRDFPKGATLRVYQPTR